MAYIYRLDNNWVSSALMPVETIYSRSTIKISSSAVNIFADNNIALGLNAGSSRMAFKHNDILFKTLKKEGPSSNITYVTRPSIERGFVQWTGSFSCSNILSDLLAATSISVSGKIELTIDGPSGTMTASGDASFEITWTSDALMLDGISVSGEASISNGTLEADFDSDELLRRLNGDYSGIDKIEYASPAEPFDLSYSRIDGFSGVYEEVEISLDYNSIIVDDFGHQFFVVPGFDFGVSASAIWIPNESLEYLKNDQFSMMLMDDSYFCEFNKDRLRSAVNEADLYIDGLVRTSVKTYIGYVRVYSSYVYIDYYYIKNSSGSDDECAMLEDTVSYGRACRLKISNSSIELRNVDSNVEVVELMPNANDFAHEVYNKIRFGAGCFKSNYKLYSYRDKRNTLEVIFNRETSSKYIKVVIEDQSTRYRATVTVKSGTKTTTTTKNFPRYSSNPLWSIGNTGYINIILKKAFDNVSDTQETLFTNGAITLDPDSIKILTRTLYVNVMDEVVSFPQLNLTYDTFAVVAFKSETELENMQINFQPATGAIYGRVAQASSYDYYTKDELVEVLNSINERYTFAMTCNISSLEFSDLDGNQHVYPFTNSTMIISELVNGASGQFYRVYFKNADSYGYVNALNYNIKE